MDHDFQDELVSYIAEANKPKLFEGSRVLLLWDEDDSRFIDAGFQVDPGEEVKHRGAEVPPDHVPEDLEEFGIKTVQPRGLRWNDGKESPTNFVLHWDGIEGSILSWRDARVQGGDEDVAPRVWTLGTFLAFLFDLF